MVDCVAFMSVARASQEVESYRYNRRLVRAGYIAAVYAGYREFAERCLNEGRLRIRALTKGELEQSRRK